jgi:hypothetical protein
VASVSKREAVDMPGWMPELDSGDEMYRWRSLAFEGLPSLCV